MLKSPVFSLLFARQWATPQVSSAEKPSFALITHEELQLKFQRSYVIFFSLFLVGKTNDQTCLMTISVMDIERRRASARQTQTSLCMHYNLEYVQ